MIIGLDLGNRYVKVFSEDYKDELFVAWKSVAEEEYNSTEVSESGLAKVRYLGDNYLMGDFGNTGINARNKGANDVRDKSNLIKLVMIARLMKTKNLTEALNIKIVTGTPYDDFEKTKLDYSALMLSNGIEVIELDGIEYKIKVTEVEVTKQGACVILTLPNRKSENYLIWDFGGETLDVSYFENGIRIEGLTMDFSLNRIFVELGKVLNTYMDVDRPSLLDARYQKSIESLILTGRYKNANVILVDNKPVELSSFVCTYLQKLVDEVIADALNELDINKTTLDNLTNIFVGGGSKLLEKELINNSMISHKRIQEEPQYSNVRAYFKIGQVKWGALVE